MIPNTIKQEQEISELLSRGYVQESGSNANGSYIKFSDGTMICTYSFDLADDAHFATSYGAIYYTTGGEKKWIFPQPFLKVYSVNGSLQLPGGIGGVGFSSNNDLTTFVKFYPYSVVSYDFTGSSKKYVYLIAIGKWK